MLPFTLPEGTTIVDDQGRDAGLRLVDVDVDTHPDIVFSNAQRYGVYRFVSLETGWAQTMMAGRHGDGVDIPAIVQAGGFDISRVRRRYIPGPRFVSYNFWGTAVASG